MAKVRASLNDFESTYRFRYSYCYRFRYRFRYKYTEIITQRSNGHWPASACASCKYLYLYLLRMLLLTEWHVSSLGIFQHVLAQLTQNYLWKQQRLWFFRSLLLLSIANPLPMEIVGCRLCVALRCVGFCENVASICICDKRQSPHQSPSNYWSISERITSHICIHIILYMCI